MTNIIAPTSIAELRDVVQTAANHATPLRIVGAGTWLHAGRAVAAQTHVSVRALAGIVEYVPGDLVITVQAGTTLAEIAAVTAAHGQWLPLDPPTGDDGTIGGTIATGSQGALGLGYGRTRDLMLGVTCVCGDGRVVRAGGRVVKNVAGFDLVRLLTGSWGTLGVLTEMSVRLHARPAVDATVAVSIDTAVAEQLNRRPMLAVTSSLAACVLLSLPAAVRIGISTDGMPDAWVLLARMTGNATRVRALQQMLSSLGTCVAVDGSVWHGVRQLDAVGSAVGRGGDNNNEHAASLVFTGAPARSAQTVRTALAWCHDFSVTDAMFVVEPMRGAVRVSGTLPPHATPQALPLGTHAVRLPERWWSVVPSAVADPLSTQLRHTFNPAGILNPGILGEPAAVLA